jgi:hypothetical protein
MRRLSSLALAFALSVSIVLQSTAGQAQEEVSAPSSVTDDQAYAPLADSVEADYLATTEDLARYVVSAEMTSAGSGTLATIAGQMTLTYRNTTGGDLSELYFRLYPNSAEYAEGTLQVADARVDGQHAFTTIARGDTLLTVSLGSSLAAGAWVEVSLEFVTTLPTDPLQSYGMFKYDSDTNTYSLAHWLPLLAGWDEVYGWNTGPVSENGDPVYTEAAVFEVELTADADLIFVTSGSALGRSVDRDRATTTYATGPSRDFVMTASTDFLVESRTVGETTVNSYYWPGSEAAGVGAAESGANSIALFNDLIGDYPFEEFDIVEVDIGNGAGGVEFPGLVYIGSSFYDPAGYAASIPGFLEFVVVHEVLHQWFYNVVGNNQYQHAFLDESLSNYLSTVFFADQYGPEAANEQANLQLRLGYFNKLFQDGDQVVNQPTDDFPTGNDYGVIVYGKGALAFMELRREIGTDPFFAALAQYYEDFAFDIAQPDDLLAAFEEASGQELDDFWNHWFNDAAGLEDFDATDLARVLRELGE